VEGTGKIYAHGSGNSTLNVRDTRSCVVAVLGYHFSSSVQRSGTALTAREAKEKTLLEFGCLCTVVVHNDYVVLDRHTHNTFTGTTILLLF
jgi:hypothetical protein